MISVKSYWYQSNFTEHMSEIVDAVKAYYEVSSSPMKLQNLMQKMNIRIRHASISHDGMVHKDGGQHVITINPRHHQKRNRFTVAHEIGHIILEEHLVSQADSDQDNSLSLLKNKWEVESFADIFASYLLVSSHSIEKFSDWRNFSVPRVIEGAREQGVSISVFLGRLLEKLGGGYIWLNHMNKPTDAEEFKWRLSSGRLPQLDIRRERYYLPKFDSIEFESPILSALDNEKGILIHNIDLDFGSLKGEHTVFAKAITSSIALSRGKTIVKGDTTILLLVLPKCIDVTQVRSFFNEANKISKRFNNSNTHSRRLFA